MSQSPDPEDSDRIIKPRTLWIIVFGGTTILMAVGFAVVMGKIIRKLIP